LLRWVLASAPALPGGLAMLTAKRLAADLGFVRLIDRPVRVLGGPAVAPPAAAI
jgi:hypothetical protein